MQYLETIGIVRCATIILFQTCICFFVVLIFSETVTEILILTKQFAKCACLNSVVISAFCAETDGMDDSVIISDSQVEVSDKSATGSFRPSDEKPYTSFEAEVNVTITLSNSRFPSTPQLGKFDLVEQNSSNVGSYELYYKKPFESKFTPYNSDRFVDTAETMYDFDNVLFPDGTFATEVLIVIHKIKSLTRNESMEIKFSLYACFQQGKLKFISCL